MKAQGLPLNFVILGALALLVLVVAVAFFMSGTATLSTAVSQQQVQTTCNNLCNQINREVQKNYTLSATMCNSTSNACLGGNALNLAKKFVETTYKVTGLGEVTCYNITSCEVTFRDATNCLITPTTSGDLKVTCI